jgi:hypothetical protein
MYFLSHDQNGEYELTHAYFERRGVLHVVMEAGVSKSTAFKSLRAVQRDTNRSFYRVGAFMNSTIKEASSLIGMSTTQFAAQCEHRSFW